MVSAEAQIEAAEAGYWCHISDPLTNWEMYTVLAGGLAEAKREHRDAVACHDHGRAARLLLEVADLTALCASVAEGLALQRARFLEGSRPWPL